MYQKKLEEDYRTLLEYGMGKLGGKWETRIMCHLVLNGRTRYSDMKEDLEGVSEAALSLALRKMTDNGIVNRYQTNGRPMVVEYEITEKWRDAVMSLRNFCKWVNNGYGDDYDVPETCRKCMAANPNWQPAE